MGTAQRARVSGLFAAGALSAKAGSMSGKRGGENENQPKVKRPCRRPPGSKTKLWWRFRPPGRSGGGEHPAPGPDMY